VLQIHETAMTFPKKATVFEFINVDNLDDTKSTEIRRKVKKHVMKDIGASRRRPQKNPIILDTVLDLDASTEQDPQASVDPGTVLDPRAQIDAVAMNPFARYPRSLHPHEHDLLRYSEILQGTLSKGPN
jgi:hypothetical protein